MPSRPQKCRKKTTRAVNTPFVCALNEKWLADRGATIRPNAPPTSLFERLKFVAGLVGTAPAPDGCTPRLLWRNDKREVVSLAVINDLVIGRDSGCDLTFADVRLSRRHCKITSNNMGVWVEDLGSTNGTRVNDRAVRRKRLQDGDVLMVGSQALAFVVGALKSSRM